ncbi:hypothetical protein DIPPA_08422 [Diplonema papillatum]|nr:hypothetical protein DIPPA_08422 [Diplonema papillatum]
MGNPMPFEEPRDSFFSMLPDTWQANLSSVVPDKCSNAEGHTVARAMDANVYVPAKCKGFFGRLIGAYYDSHSYRPDGSLPPPLAGPVDDPPPPPADDVRPESVSFVRSTGELYTVHCPPDKGAS